MSSISIDASGQRGVSLNLNDPVRTGASIPSKNDDDVTVYVGGAGEVSILIPLDAKVKVIRDGDRLVVFAKTSFLNATAYSGVRLGKSGQWTHASLSARKDAADAYAGNEVVREVTLSELLGLDAEQ